jgi:hypothetical protein
MQCARAVFSSVACPALEYIAHLGQHRHNSLFGIFELLVWKETFADALLTGIVS